MSDFEPIYGGCICGSVKYSINSKPLFTQVCHCLDCKKLTGSSYVMNTSIFEDSLKINGELLKAELIAGSGKKCTCLLYTSPSPRDKRQSRMPSSA